MTTKMKCLVIYPSLMVMILALTGCGIPQDQYDQLKSELTSSQQQVGDLTKAGEELEKSLNNATKLNEEINTRVEDLTKAGEELEKSLNNATKLNEEINTRVEDLTKAGEELENSLNNATKLNEENNSRVEDLTKANGELENSLNNSTRLNEELSAIAAYSLWYDHYYGTGAYSYDNVTAFNSQLGSLIAAINDTNSRSAFDVYHGTDYDYRTLVASLPDDNIWTQSQYESWLDAGKSREEALGQVGGHLLNKVEAISWFGEK